MASLVRSDRARSWAVAAAGGTGVLCCSGVLAQDGILLVLDCGAKPAVVQPAFEVDAQPIFKPYFGRAGVNPADVSGRAFELVVAAWLGDLIRLAEQPENLSNGQHWLVETGLLDAVRNGRIEYEVAT
jgi:hypothetical protein